MQVREARSSGATLEAPATIYRRGAAATVGPLALAVALLAVVAAVALTRGAAAIPPGTALGLLLERLPFVDLGISAPERWERIVIEVRLPRVLAAAAVGGGLAFSGAAYQGVFRNPLADPFLLGVAAGAALGAAIAIVSPLDAATYGFGWVPLFAFGGAALAVVLAYLVSQVGRTVANTTLILAGVAISAIFGSITSFLLLTGGESARPIFSFLFGSFNTANWDRLLIAAPYLLVGVAVVAAHARVLNVLQLDEEQASQLGGKRGADEADRARRGLAGGGDGGRGRRGDRLRGADRAARRADAVRGRLPPAAAAHGAAGRGVPDRRRRALAHPDLAAGDPGGAS